MPHLLKQTKSFVHSANQKKLKKISTRQQNGVTNKKTIDSMFIVKLFLLPSVFPFFLLFFFLIEMSSTGSTPYSQYNWNSSGGDSSFGGAGGRGGGERHTPSDPPP